MDIYFKITAGILVTMILCLLLPKQNKDVSILLCLAVCSMALICVVAYLEPLLSFLNHIITLGNLPEELIAILFKVVGIGMLSQITSVICIDAGNQSLAKALQLVTTALVLWMCIPLLEQLLLFVENILGAS